MGDDALKTLETAQTRRLCVVVVVVVVSVVMVVVMVVMVPHVPVGFKVAQVHLPQCFRALSREFKHLIFRTPNNTSPMYWPRRYGQQASLTGLSLPT